VSKGQKTGVVVVVILAHVCLLSACLEWHNWCHHH